MPSQRSLRRIASLVLAWFALYLGAAVASPLLQAGAYVVVCSADGVVRLVPADDAGGVGHGHATLHCPLCAPAGAPPPPAAGLAAPPHASGTCDLLPAATIRPSAPDAAPPPARGPPASA